MGTTSMAQVNIRLNAEVKKAGDDILRRADIMPTQLVRAVWAKAALGVESLDQLMEALTKEPSEYTELRADEWREGDKLVERIARRQEVIERELGLDALTYVLLDDDVAQEMLLEEQEEREREKMAWHAT